MPIQTPSQYTAPVYFPNNDYKVSRYLDLFKFISLIQNESIFFARLDLMEDRFEGTLPIKNVDLYKDWTRSLFTTGSLPTNNIEESVENASKTNERIREKFRKHTCVSCWNKSSNESYALWKIYSEIDKGIMITSSVNKLQKSFEVCSVEILMSEVKYINHNLDIIDSSNLNYPIIHKNVAYGYEDELRLINIHDLADYEFDWKAQPNNNGNYFKVNISELIDEIVISPYASQHFFDVVKNLVKTYKLDKKIKYSDLR